MSLTITTSWRSEDWLDILKNEVEPRLKHVAFEEYDRMGVDWDYDTKSYEPVVLDQAVMIVVDDGAEDYLKEHFLTELKTESGYWNPLERDLQYGISQWIFREIGHKIW